MDERKPTLRRQEDNPAGEALSEAKGADAPGAQGDEEGAREDECAASLRRAEDMQRQIDELVCVNRRYMARIRTAEGRAAAAVMGVAQGRLDYAVQLAGLDEIDIDDPGAGEKIAEAIGALLDKLPEFKGGAGTGTVGAHPRRSVRKDAFERGFTGI
jgi:hypothetical protein